MELLVTANCDAADLHWLTRVLTGSREIAFQAVMQAHDGAEAASDFFSNWLSAWSRKIAISKALAAVKEDLARSAREMAQRDAQEVTLRQASRSVDRETTKSELEHALLQIDVFPRAAFLIVVFERMPLEDAAILLGADPELVREAWAAAMRELTIQLAMTQGEVQHV
jgi:DNA-directed RNA polymerase specialized sigma24 family protein